MHRQDTFSSSRLRARQEEIALRLNQIGRDFSERRVGWTEAKAEDDRLRNEFWSNEETLIRLEQEELRGGRS